MMYGLFHVTYDYYEAEDLVCLSEDKNKLIEHYSRQQSLKEVHIPLLLSEESKREARADYQQHYRISNVKVV